MGDGIYAVAKRGLFWLPAERAHEVTVRCLRVAEELGLVAPLYPVQPAWARPVQVMGLTFPNVLGLAAGMDKAGEAVDGFGALGFGHVEVGTVTPRPQAGNPKPRLFRLVEHEAIINRMGFNNPGMEAVRRNLVRRRSFRGVLGVNLGKNADTPNERAADDYREGMRAFYGVADYLTVNLSSPNTEGLRDLQEVEACERLLTTLLEEREKLSMEAGVRRPVAVKVAPDLSEEQVEDLAALLSQLRMDGVIVTNTTIDRKAVAGHPLAGERGGLSGGPLRERGLECLRLWRGNLDVAIPILSVGGILEGTTAVERLEAGAALLQIYTGLIYRGPGLVGEILEVAAQWLDERRKADAVPGGRVGIKG